ncbi:MAG: AmmeMemoRadiSam system protein B [Patescibacteria group bacterium]
MVKKYLFFLLIISALAILFIVVLTLDFEHQSFGFNKFNQNKDNNMTKKEITRQSAVAGSFYPAGKAELSSLIDKFLAAVPQDPAGGVPRILIVPHAGLEYSGSVAAYSFKQLLNSGVKQAIIIGPSHHFPILGLYLSAADFWQTPLGLVKVSDINQALAKENDFTVSEQVHQPEHALEIEVPFLQTVIPGVEIVPIIVGQLDANQRSNFVSVLNKYLASQTVLVVSVDMSHYHPQNQALALDQQSIDHILDLNNQEILDDEIDAPWVVSSVLALARQNGWQPKLLKHATSGDVTGDESSVVGYGAIGFYGEIREQKTENRDQRTENSSDEYSQTEKTELLQLARTTLEQYFKTGKINQPKNINPKFLAKRGVFVTLNKNGSLRGCIGYIEPIKPLLEAIMDNAISAALHDSRFNPVTSDELKDIEIEISILSVPQPDTIDNITKNKLGTVLQNGSRGATYLPQVWQEVANSSDFFTSLCLKGGLKPNCFTDSETKVFSYQAIVFRE